MTKLSRRLFVGSVAAFAAPTIVRSQTPQPPLLLTFALDCSASMYYLRSMIEREVKYHYEIQRDGHVRALLDPEIKAALVDRSVVGQVILWSGIGKHKQLIKPTPLLTTGAVEDFAEDIFRLVPKDIMTGLTDHATAIAFAVACGIPGYKHVIDLCSDEGPYDDMELSKDRKYTDFQRCQLASAAAYRAGVQINAIGINNGQTTSTSDGLAQAAQTLDGFTVPVFGWDSFPDSLRQKIIKELRLA